jgi:hypothetical protein
MNRKNIAARCLPILLALQLSTNAAAQRPGLETNPAIGRPSSVSISNAVYRGKSALRLTDLIPDGAATIIPLKTENFKDGTITADIAGQPRKGAPEYARGFVGIAFRVSGEKRYEAIYIRPTNGRSTDQFRRNHTAQYISLPDFDWERLRVEHPGKYESYANVAPGEWSRLRITVEGQTARLYVGGDEQPSLIVNDLKLGADGSGGVALWVGPHTDAYFANVTVEHEL